MANDDAGNGDNSTNQTPTQGGDSGKGSDQQSTPPKNTGNDASGGDSDRRFTQADLDRKIDERIARERKKFADYDDLKTGKQAAEQGLEKLREDFAAALGFKKDDSPDPAALQRTVAERESKISGLQSENAGLRREVRAWEEASRQGANTLALLDSRSFLDSLSQLDPAAEDFRSSLEKAVTQALDANPALKADAIPRVPKPDPSQGSGRPAPTGAERGVAEAERRFGAKTGASTS